MTLYFPNLLWPQRNLVEERGQIFIRQEELDLEVARLVAARLLIPGYLEALLASILYDGPPTVTLGDELDERIGILISPGDALLWALA